MDEEAGKKRPARKTLYGMQQAFYVEKEMGIRLERCKVLQ